MKIKTTYKNKPLVFIPCNPGGGVRKSRVASLIYHCLVCMGLNPLVIALDTNDSLIHQIRKENCLPEAEILRWDINDETATLNFLHLILMKALEESRPVVIDLPAKGGLSLGIQTLLRTGLFEHVTVIGFVPILPDDKSAAGAIEAIEAIAPDLLIKFEFFGKIKAPDNVIFQTLDALNPDAIAQIGELTSGESNLWVEELPVLPPQLADYVASGGLATAKWTIFRNYWMHAKMSIDAALAKAVPQLADMVEAAKSTPPKTQPAKQTA